jgi:hypothetical protein
VDGLIRIVGVQRSEKPESEFILLQNQGSRRLVLRGHAVIADSALCTGDLSVGAHCFTDEESVGTGVYIMLVTGKGEPRWGRTKDGAYLYLTYMNRHRSIWNNFPGPVHVMSSQHTYVERDIEHLIMR